MNLLCEFGCNSNEVLVQQNVKSTCEDIDDARDSESNTFIVFEVEFSAENHDGKTNENKDVDEEEKASWDRKAQA